MDKKTEALKLALEALVRADRISGYPNNKETITAIREALAQPEQEPVAIVTGYYGGRLTINPFNLASTLPTGMALYTAPPQRTWVGLTQSEFQQAVEGLEDLEDCWAQIEAKIKEKNT